jgi:hypothetical protein
MPVVEERVGQMGPDETGGAGDDYAHGIKAQGRRHKAEAVPCFCLLPFAFCLGN